MLLGGRLAQGACVKGGVLGATSPFFGFLKKKNDGRVEWKRNQAVHGCCWDTFCIFAYCGLVGNPHLLKFKLLLPFQRQPSLGVSKKMLAFLCRGWPRHLKQSLGGGEARSVTSGRARGIGLRTWLWLQMLQRGITWQTCIWPTDARTG